MIPNLFDPRTTHVDNIYMNAKFRNTSKTSAQIISFSGDRNESLVEAANMYYMIVESFSIPNASLPIFVFDNSDSSYSVKIGTANKVDLVFIDRGDLVNPGNTNSGNIYYIGQFLKMLNTAIGSGNGEMVLNDDGRFQFNRTTTNQTIYFSSKVYDLFLSLEATHKAYNSASGEDYLIFDPSPGAASQLKQEEKSQYAWSDIAAVYLFSNTIPIVEENFSNRLDNGSDEKFKTINDFIPFQSEDGGIDRTPWVFTSDYPKLIDMRSDTAINSVDFTVSALAKSGELRRVHIPPGSEASLKLRFSKKAIFNNEYNLTDLKKRVKQYAMHNQHHR